MGHALRIASDSCLISGICFSVSVSPFYFCWTLRGTLMDLITSVPTPIPSSALPPPSPSSASPAALSSPSSEIGKMMTTDRKSKRGTLSQIQSDTISAAKAALNPVRINILPRKQKQKKKGAAVAYVADLFKVPVIFMKAVTDIVDGDKPISEEYLQNVSAVTAALGQAVTQVIHYINGKCISEL